MDDKLEHTQNVAITVLTNSLVKNLKITKDEASELAKAIEKDLVEENCSLLHFINFSESDKVVNRRATVSVSNNLDNIGYFDTLTDKQLKVVNNLENSVSDIEDTPEAPVENWQTARRFNQSLKE